MLCPFLYCSLRWIRRYFVSRCTFDLVDNQMHFDAWIMTTERILCNNQGLGLSESKRVVAEVGALGQAARLAVEAIPAPEGY